VGGVLPDGMKIRKAKLRGEVSQGMLCSARELGLGQDHSGILALSDEHPVGSSFVDAMSLDDEILDVEVTANRGDLLGHVGVARELGAPQLKQIPGSPDVELEVVSDGHEVEVAGVRLVNDAPDLCGRFTGAVVRGVEVGPSPDWLQMRLRAIGARPINNVVDATNWVLFELGQPLHAYDLAKLRGSEVRIRMARDGETVRTLDDREHELDASMLVIADAERTIDIAGIMGEDDSAVSADTTDIFLECAHFDPASIRSTRKALGIQSDAGYRFERYVDADGQRAALERCLQVILATAGGELHPEMLEVCPRPFEAPVIDLELARVEALLGVSFEPATITELLEPLGFGCEVSGAQIAVTVPGWRAADVTRPVDLIEEIARRWGYDRFPEESAGWRPGTVPDHPLFTLEARIRDQMIGFGFFEAQTPAFVPEEEGEVRLSNPISKEEPVLRREILPSLRRRVEYNLARGARDVALFEIGTSFSADEAGKGDVPVAEETRVAFVCTGAARHHWTEDDRSVDVWDLKGWTEHVARLAWGDETVVRPHDGHPDGWRPGWVVQVVDAVGTVRGTAGAIHPDELDLPPWAGDVFGLEMSLPDEPEIDAAPTAQPLPAYPGSDRDLALIVPSDVRASRIEEIARGAGGPLLVDVTVFDRYEGEGVPDGMVSLAWRFRYQASDRTLTDEEVDAATEKIAEALEEECGARIRGRAD
ncbi:MAG TPA: phenylalanine--tRNA ligase subunit beta, partial [Longimicrobiales bacterium]|nr:phenylalanine--tRNA ligase subunit beta [Longimicrobiales bacterium]